VNALLGAVGSEIALLGQEYVAHVGDIVSDRGGVTAAVADPGFGRVDVWVAVVSGELVGECDCLAEGLCVHAVAVALAAPERGVVFSSIRSREGSDPVQERFLSVAGTLGRRKLIRLVAEHAAKDRLFAAMLLAAAGRLQAPSVEDIRTVRRAVEATAAIPEGSYRWQLHDLVTAGRDLAAELEVLAERPATVDLLDVVEEAIAVWATFLGHLSESWGENFDTDPITQTFTDLHLKLCEACDLPPVELASRLVDLLGKRDEGLFLDIPDAYEDLLGDEGVEEFENLTA
jgi:uncharacterized Zn finger protein